MRGKADTMCQSSNEKRVSACCMLSRSTDLEHRIFANAARVQEALISGR